VTVSKKIVCFGIIIILARATFAQHFTFIPDRLTGSDTLNGEIAFQIPIKNISSNTITLTIKRTMNELPNDWTSSLCFDQLCFAPFIDSVRTTADFGSSPLAPGNVRDFSLHVFPYMNHGTARIRLVAYDEAAPQDSIALQFTATSKTTAINDPASPVSFTVSQNFPNPFNPSTSIRYTLAEASQVTIDLYDISGKLLYSLMKGYLQPGEYSLTIDGTRLSSGNCICVFRAGEKTISRKILLMK
jgi:hypothetical protein